MPSPAIEPDAFPIWTPHAGEDRSRSQDGRRSRQDWLQRTIRTPGEGKGGRRRRSARLVGDPDAGQVKGQVRPETKTKPSRIEPARSKPGHRAPDLDGDPDRRRRHDPRRRAARPRENRDGDDAGQVKARSSKKTGAIFRAIRTPDTINRLRYLHSEFNGPRRLDADQLGRRQIQTNGRSHNAQPLRLKRLQRTIRTGRKGRPAGPSSHKGDLWPNAAASPLFTIYVL